MTTKSEIQTLLRFLSQDAKVPLPTAMGKVKDLQAAGLTSPESLSKTSLTAIQAIFIEEKLAKQILSAAKRTTKKRKAGDVSSESPAKRKKPTSLEPATDPATIEAALTLPTSTANEEELTSTTLYTNRAPLVLAFALILLKHTTPHQPLSSRLSLAQAVVSMNSKTKAINLGIDSGTTAESEGWGQGQPKMKIMGREIRVMKRWGYEWRNNKSEGENIKEEDSQSTLTETQTNIEQEPALWGLDLEALRSSNGPPISNNHSTNSSNLPIYNPDSARAYLLKSFAFPPSETSTPVKKLTPSALKAQKEHNLALLLQSLDLLYASWAHVLSREELDRRAWAWYLAVRPDVEHGVAGWGGKGEVRLEKILELRRKG